jgi:hypothetical protein
MRKKEQRNKTKAVQISSAKSVAKEKKRETAEHKK